jgi:hypothetical protein
MAGGYGDSARGMEIWNVSVGRSLRRRRGTCADCKAGVAGCGNGGIFMRIAGALLHADGRTGLFAGKNYRGNVLNAINAREDRLLYSA